MTGSVTVNSRLTNDIVEHVRRDLMSHQLTADQAQAIKWAVDQRVIGSQYQRETPVSTSAIVQAHESMLEQVMLRLTAIERKLRALASE